MLSGCYPSDDFAELRPRHRLGPGDRHAHRPARRQRLAVTSGGTIPDRGLFGVFLVGGRPRGRLRRVGELDEEMVYESRVGDVFAARRDVWRIEDITARPGAGRRPRPASREAPVLEGRRASAGRPSWAPRSARSSASSASRRGCAPSSGCAPAGLDELAVANLVSYLAEQREATGHVPDDRTLVVERFRDELGDWRLVAALARTARRCMRRGRSPSPPACASASAIDVQAAARRRRHRRAAARHRRRAARAELAVFEPDELEQLVTAEVGGSALFASRFRECAARALLLPRLQPGPADPAVAAAAAGLAAARGRPQVPELPDRARDSAGVPAGCLRPARADRR